METRRTRRIRHTRIRRTVAAVMALCTVGLGVGLSGPAGAAGRYRDHGSASDNGCDSQYRHDSGQGASHSNDTGNSNEGYC
jgi:hypothetical protein